MFGFSAFSQTPFSSLVETGNIITASFAYVEGIGTVTAKGTRQGEGWTPVTPGTETWTEITAGTETWTDITSSTDIWLRQG
jgi:hypothetical protein